MNRLGTVSTHAEEVDDEQEFEKFDEFVHTLSPDDFSMRGGRVAECSLMASGMSAEAAAIAREAQMRSEASEAARIAYVTQARTLRERRGSFIKMVVVSVLVAAICSRLRGTVGALGFSISTGLVIWGVVDAVMLTNQIKVLDKRAMDMMRARDAAAKIAAEAQEL